MLPRMTKILGIVRVTMQRPISYIESRPTLDLSRRTEALATCNRSLLLRCSPHQSLARLSHLRGDIGFGLR
ncbi:hypothetical protein L6452_15467 [Arctium lappa]|uniref:Uncharacterized protein n=1 Tax=Arctium lappa TaxID=4217 RepID=A0ACB9CNV7_ARCLA|nr:hypothetical protein L6452_15467 [Arctium lappa]